MRVEDLAWENNIQGRNAYIIDSVTGVNSKNLAMFIREIPPGAATGLHHHNFEAVGYVLEGRGHDVHDGTSVKWKKGDGLYIPPLAEHQHFNDDPKHSAWLLFITNWPLLTHLGITTFVQSSEKPRRSVSSRPTARRKATARSPSARESAMSGVREGMNSVYHEHDPGRDTCFDAQRH